LQVSIVETDESILLGVSITRSILFLLRIVWSLPVRLLLMRKSYSEDMQDGLIERHFDRPRPIDGCFMADHEFSGTSPSMRNATRSGASF
jgi:hypothetical protein